MRWSCRVWLWGNWTILWRSLLRLVSSLSQMEMWLSPVSWRRSGLRIAPALSTVVQSLLLQRQKNLWLRRFRMENRLWDLCSESFWMPTAHPATDNWQASIPISLLELSGQLRHWTPSRQECNYHQPPVAPQVMNMTKGKRWSTTAQIHNSSAEHNPYYNNNNNKIMMKRLGMGGLDFLQQFYDGFYIQPLGLYCGRMFLAYLFRCFEGFGKRYSSQVGGALCKWFHSGAKGNSNCILQHNVGDWYWKLW